MSGRAWAPDRIVLIFHEAEAMNAWNFTSTPAFPRRYGVVRKQKNILLFRLFPVWARGFVGP
jgi:hypothetical protein